MRPLQVNAFTGSIRRDQNPDILILFEERLHLPPVIPQHAAMDGNDRLILPKEGPDLISQVIQGVPMLRKDDQLLQLTALIFEERIILQDGRQFIPLLVQPAVADLVGHILQPLEGLDLRFQFLNGLGR